MQQTIKAAIKSGKLSIDKNWLLVCLGLAALYVPTYWVLTHSLWQTDDQSHGAIIALVVIYLFTVQGNKMAEFNYAPRNGLGGAILAIGLILYVLGRSQDILMFEVGSQIPVIAGTLLLMQGAASVRIFWFPLMYMIFMVPLPGIVVDTLTGSLKQWISVIAEEVLHGFGYPIARNGVVITIAQYQLLVADACSGLNSMFSLLAIGLLFMYLVARPSWVHNGMLLASILPVAFIANVVRVLTLILITYHFGDEVGQGFLHGFAGILLLMVAVFLLFLLDSSLVRWIDVKS